MFSLQCHIKAHVLFQGRYGFIALLALLFALSSSAANTDADLSQQITVSCLQREQELRVRLRVKIRVGVGVILHCRAREKCIAKLVLACCRKWKEKGSALPSAGLGTTLNPPLGF